jgi:hypothetical protein
MRNVRHDRLCENDCARLNDLMNSVFISQQLGQYTQMLLSTYTRRINSSSDWSVLENRVLPSIRFSSSQP